MTKQGHYPRVKTPNDLLAEHNGYCLKEATAQGVRDFFAGCLCHSKGQFAGLPFELLPWQWWKFIRPLFGWKHKKTNLRRFRRAYIEIPKKMGKTTICAGIALYCLVADHEAGAEIYLAAVDREQAGLLFEEAKNMVEASPELSAILEIVPSTKRIVYPATKSYLKTLSADVPSKEGLNAHAIIFDELHAQPDRRMWDTLAYASASRRQPLQIAITTAGFDKHSICWEQHGYAQKVLDGVIEDFTFFPLIYAADAKDDWTAPETWHKANPSLGVTVSVESMAADCKEAIESPAKENAFRRYRLNQWTEQDTRWITTEKWDSCRADFSADSLKGKACYCGLDLASTTDIASFSMLFPQDDGSFKALVKYWVPENGVHKRSRKDRVPYDQWARQGLITATPGDIIDYNIIRRDILELNKVYNIREIAYDRWAATQLSSDLQGDGISMVTFGQGYSSMASPTKEFEKLVLSGKLKHNGDPVLRWMASNVTVESDSAGNLKPSKAKSTEKIDGIVATVMALGRAMLVPAGQSESVYSERGIQYV